MSDAIRGTIVNALSTKGLDVHDLTSYSEYIDAVTEALAERAYAATDHLISLATNDLGLGEDEARDIIESTGLPVRPQPEPEVEDEPEVNTEDPAVADDAPVTRAEFNQLTSVIGKLVTLAERHLGPLA